jgi:hypothetical protein
MNTWRCVFPNGKSVQEMVGIASRNEGDTQKYTQAWGPENLPRKILLTTETTATIVMGRKVTAVVSTGVRRMGQGAEGRKFFLPNDTRSERIITGGCVPCAVYHGASGQIFLGDVDKLGGGETSCFHI